jgi:hypothetical protein
LEMNGKYVSIIAVVAIAILLVGSATFSSAQAKKSSKVAVTITNWNPSAHKVEYRIETGQEVVLGKKIFDFWFHEIENDTPTFTLDVKFSTNGLHKNQKLYACVDDKNSGDGFCGDNFKYKVGKKLHTTVDMQYTPLAYFDGTTRNDTGS